MAKGTSKVRVAIIGASGYVGSELVRVLVQHPNVEIAALFADRNAGFSMSEIYPHFESVSLPKLLSTNDVNWASLDVEVIFCAMPHGYGQKIIKELVDNGGVKVIDLSADFRIKDESVYQDWYKFKHGSPDLLKKSVYGLTEFLRDEIKYSSLIACPGCYPTSVLLPLYPLLKSSLIKIQDIIIDSKSGVSGAGRAENQKNLYSEISDSFHPYAISEHRHIPEIEQQLSIAAGQLVNITFTPHLLPMSRGILSTIYVRLNDGITYSDVRNNLNDTFMNEPFVKLLDDKIIPQTKMVKGSNHCMLNVFEDRYPDKLIIVSAIDNLLKGAAGQAVQNFNLLSGLDEASGLGALPLFP